MPPPQQNRQPPDAPAPAPAPSHAGLRANTPRAWLLIARFARWRGGFPLGGVLIVAGIAAPTYWGLTAIGVFVVLIAVMIRVFRHWTSVAHTATKAATAEPPPPPPPVPLSAYHTSAAAPGDEPPADPVAAARADERG